MSGTTTNSTTIAQLAPAGSASDDDEIPVSQNGIVRKITRAQLLAGMQPDFAISSGTLLGRAGAGTGAPGPITIGENLALNGNTLAASAAPFMVNALPPGVAPAASDVVPLGQNGENVAVSYAQFLSGMAGIPGVPASLLVATAVGGSASRTLAQHFGDVVAAEDFGARGDGVSDDTAALAAAVASGLPVRLGPRTYLVSGQWTIQGDSVALIGVPGKTVLRRHSQTGNGAWISVQSGRFVADGIVFDANQPGVTTDSWAVLVTPSCTGADFHRCVFTGSGGATMGCGLTFQASDPIVAKHVVRDCEAYGNVVHGIWVQAVRGVRIEGCRAHDNGVYGICVDYADPDFVRRLHHCTVSGNEIWGNQRGISVGNFNAANSTPPVWGNAKPDAYAILISENNCHDNAAYGIAASGFALSVRGNILSGNGMLAGGGAGILANVSSSMVDGNIVTGGSQFGIDAGGSIDSMIAWNHVNGAVHGINPGGSQNVRVTGNTVEACTGWSILVQNVETDGLGRNFGIACASLAITDNALRFSVGNGGGGILLLDAPQNVLVARNSFILEGNAAAAQCLWAHTDAAIVRDNSINLGQRTICNPESVAGVEQVAFPDVLDTFMITDAPVPVQSIVGMHQRDTAGQIGYIKVTDGGANYTQANVAIGGSGAGAAARAVISNGSIIGIVVTAPGSGYGSLGANVPVTITGDGNGAAAAATAGLPVLEERQLRVRCNCAVKFLRVGSTPFQENWTLSDLTVPANCEVDWTGTWGGWRAGVVALADYLQFGGDGALTIRSTRGSDIFLRPASGGHVRLGSDAEPGGAVSAVGRGSPAGVVTAPPGSDYRNLDGGAGTTFWIKQTGTDTGGWVAIG